MNRHAAARLAMTLVESSLSDVVKAHAFVRNRRLGLSVGDVDAVLVAYFRSCCRRAMSDMKD